MRALLIFFFFSFLYEHARSSSRDLLWALAVAWKRARIRGGARRSPREWSLASGFGFFQSGLGGVWSVAFLEREGFGGDEGLGFSSSVALFLCQCLNLVLWMRKLF